MLKTIFNLPTTLLNYIRSIFVELRRVEWLSLRQVAQATLVVIAITTIFTLMLVGMDNIFVSLRTIILNII